MERVEDINATLALRFAEWIAENHFRLYDLKSNYESVWKSESERNMTTNELFVKFMESLKV
jgi:hypothetical protein